MEWKRFRETSGKDTLKINEKKFSRVIIKLMNTPLAENGPKASPRDFARGPSRLSDRQKRPL